MFLYTTEKMDKVLAGWRYIYDRKEVVLYTPEFLREYKDKITKKEWQDWTSFGCSDENVYDEFKDYIDWHILVITHRLSENFIREHLDYIDRSDLNRQRKHMSEDFKREMGI